MQEILSALRPVRRRIRRNRFLRGAAAGLAAGFGAAVVLQLISFFVPVSDRGWRGLMLVPAAALAAAAGNALRRVSDRTAAREADACGLKERAITALEGGEEEIHRLQRQDACAALRGLDVRQIRAGSARKALGTALCLGAAFGALLLVPSPQDREAAAGKALRQTLREGMETIDRAAEEDAAELTEETRSELRRITGELRRELQDSRDAADALVALDRAETRVEQMRRQTAGDAETAKAGAGEAEQGSAEGQDGGAAEGAGGESSAGAETGQPGSGTRAAENAADGTKAALAALKTAVNPSAQSAAGTQNAADASKAENAANASKAENTANASSAANASGSAGGAQNAAGNAADGTQAADGAGNQAGGSGGSGDGQAGGGAGEGSTNLEQSGGGPSSGGHANGSRDPRYREGAYETIYDPERTAVSRRDEITNQNRLGDDGSVQTETGPGRGELGGDVPWGEVFREYADTEALAADRENLTIRARQWVTDYFSLLTEQQGGKEAEQ